MKQLNFDDISNSMSLAAIQKHCQILVNLGCIVAVKTPDGSLLGNGELKIKEKNPRSPFKKGTILKAIKTSLDKLELGKPMFIPVGEFPSASLASTVSSYCSRNYGNGTCTTKKVDGGILVLKVL